MEFKASNFIIALIIITGCFAPLFTYLVVLTNNYGVPVPGAYNQTFQIIQNRTQINQQTAALKSSVLNEEEQSQSFIGEALDILGKYFERGYKSAQILPQTISIFDTMAAEVTSSNNPLFGNTGNILYFIAISIVTVGILALLISALLKWWI